MVRQQKQELHSFHLNTVKNLANTQENRAIHFLKTSTTYLQKHNTDKTTNDMQLTVYCEKTKNIERFILQKSFFHSLSSEKDQQSWW